MREATKTKIFGHIIDFDTRWEMYSSCLVYLLTYLLIYLLTPWYRVLLEKLTRLHLVK